MHTDGEVLLSNIVLEEFCSFYEKSLAQKITALKKANNDLHRDSFFSSIKNSDTELDKEFKKAVIKFREAVMNDPIHNGRIAQVKPTMIDGLELTKFILQSRESKEQNVQIRDYLIWDSVLNFSLQHSQDITENFMGRTITFRKAVVTFITKDRGFEENELFQALLARYGINNIEVLESIPDFLEKKGFYFDFITQEVIKTKISPSRIMKDLSKDMGALLSYVSERYDKNCYEKEIVESEIQKVEVLEHYTYVDSEDGKHKFSAQLKVWVRVVFEEDKDGCLESLKAEKTNRWSSLETYDEKHRPFFERPILFFYGGLVNVKRKTMTSVRFFDYMPDMFLSE
jgi:hypothetical protein